MEPFYPLHVFACERCYLVQLEAFVPPDEIFTEYAYFSAYSTAWVEHARAVRRDDPRAARARARTTSSSSSPRTTATCSSTSSAPASRSSGSTRRPTSPRRPRSAACRRSSTFFGRETARAPRRRGQAREPRRRQQRPRAGSRPERLRRRREDRCSATTGRRRSSSRTCSACSTGSSTTRSTTSTSRTSRSRRSRDPSRARARRLRRRGAVDARRLAARLRAARRAARTTTTRGRRRAARARGGREGLRSPERYARFAEDVKESKRALLDLLIRLRREGKQVVGYGAPGKGNTLLNYCGIRTDLLDYTVDRNPYKHGLFTPGTHIPIHPAGADRRDAARLRRSSCRGTSSTRSRRSSRYVAEWGGQLIVPIPLRDGRRDRCDGAPSGWSMTGRARCMKVVIFCGGFGVRMGEETQRIPEADDPGREPADPLAHHEVVRVVGAQRLRPLPRLQGRVRQGVLPQLQRGALERLRALERRPRRRSSSAATSPTGGSRSSTPASSRRSASGCSRSRRTSATTSTSSPPTATGSRTRRSTR